MNHIWKIYNLKRTISNGVVNVITYACESEFSGSTTRKIGNLTLSGSDTEPGFVPYEDLTESKVLEWVDADVDKTMFETENSASIAASIVTRAAITESNGTPW